MNLIVVKSLDVGSIVHYLSQNSDGTRNKIQPAASFPLLTRPSQTANRFTFLVYDRTESTHGIEGPNHLLQNDLPR